MTSLYSLWPSRRKAYSRSQLPSTKLLTEICAVNSSGSSVCEGFISRPYLFQILEVTHIHLVVKVLFGFVKIMTDTNFVSRYYGIIVFLLCIWVARALTFCTLNKSVTEFSPSILADCLLLSLDQVVWFVYWLLFSVGFSLVYFF